MTSLTTSPCFCGSQQNYADCCEPLHLASKIAETPEHDASEGFVTFKVNYFYQNLYCELHEKSLFIKQDGQWRYLEGTLFPVADIKISRNDNCPCQSGKKYKKCHSV